jgi:secreted trypsin-like serine protease
MPTELTAISTRIPARSRSLGLLVGATILALACCAPASAVVGGAPAQEGAFPSLAYLVDVQGKYVYQCTGTVIAPSLVLTAGHCAQNMKTGVVNKASGYRVVTGTVDPAMPGATVSRVLGVIVYPWLARKVDNGDAALLVLSTPTKAPAIALANASEAHRFSKGSPAVIAGWGIMSFDQKLPTEALRFAETVVQGAKWCRGNAPPFYSKSELCTVSPPTYSTGACSGDSGGPLLARRSNGETVEIGIAVHVYGRCSTRRPSVFVNVGSIHRWVRTWIEAYKVSPPPPTSSPPPSLPAATTPSP